MFILPVNLFTNKNYQLTNYQSGIRFNAGLTNDVFVKSSNVSFGGLTTAGEPLKVLRDIICPYSGTKMLLGIEFKNFENKLNKLSTAKDSVELLKSYEKYMQPVERDVFQRLEQSAQNEPDSDFQKLLQYMYKDAFINLKLEEFEVFDKIESHIREFAPETALRLREQFSRFRMIITKNDRKKPFKRKKVIEFLQKVKVNPNEQKSINELIKIADTLPRSGTSANAFIVKYANPNQDRSHQEIAKRLLLPSVANIEHIKPASMGGGNEISNFLLTSTSANSARGNMSLNEFIEMNPNVMRNCQKYINDIISAIHAGRLKGYETYPYEVAKTLFKESQGLIKLDLSKYKYSKEAAIIKEKQWEARKAYEQPHKAR